MIAARNFLVAHATVDTAASVYPASITVIHAVMPAAAAGHAMVGTCGTFIADAADVGIFLPARFAFRDFCHWPSPRLYLATFRRAGQFYRFDITLSNPIAF